MLLLGMGPKLHSSLELETILIYNNNVVVVFKSAEMRMFSVWGKKKAILEYS